MGGERFAGLKRLVQSVDGIGNLSQCKGLFADQHRGHPQIVACFRLSKPPDEVLRDRAQPVGDEQEIAARVMSHLKRVEDVG